MKHTDSSPKKKAYLYWFLGGLIVGLLLAFMMTYLLSGKSMKFVRFETRSYGEIQQLTVNTLLIQDNTPVGYLKQGTRIWFDTRQAPDKQAQVILGWGSQENIDEVIHAVTDENTLAKPEVTLERAGK